eukprot:816994_1
MNQLNINNNEAKQSDLPPNRKRKVPEDGAEEYDALIVLHRIEDIVAKIAGNFEFGSTVHATRPTPKQLKSLQDDIHSLDPIFRLSSKLIYKIQSKRITALVQKNKYIRFIENTTLDMVKTGQMNKYKFWTSFDPLRFQLPHPVRHRLLLDRLARDNLQSNVADLRTVVTALDQVIDIYNKDIESMLLASLADYKEYLRKISDDKEVTKDTWNIDSILFKLDPTLYEQRRKWTEQSRIDQQTEAFVTLVGTNNAQLVNNMSYKHHVCLHSESHIRDALRVKGPKKHPPVIGDTNKKNLKQFKQKMNPKHKTNKDLIKFTPSYASLLPDHDEDADAVMGDNSHPLPIAIHAPAVARK